MKNKLMVLVGLLFLFFIFAAIWDMTRSLLMSKTELKIVKGEIVVVFKPEISEKEAADVLKKYQLKGTDRFFRYDYVTYYAKDDVLDKAAEQLRKMPMIKDARLMAKDQITAKPWIVVGFNRLVSRDEILDFIKPINNLYVETNFYSADIQKVMVPSGKEEYFADLLQKDSSVKYASVNSIGSFMQ